ncbi:MAG: copper resistance protein B [Gallionellaceae bacterium]|jgi:copper resistance protein B|nr:copper resistance protein B [Gallionellaceae bacterium]
MLTTKYFRMLAALLLLGSSIAAHAQDMPAMDHGDMRMQDDSAPTDARDPHAYSDGFKRGEGDYAVTGAHPLMLMDEHRFSALLGEKLERQFTRHGDDSTAYDLQAWYGTTYDRLVVKAEGDVAKGKLQESRSELLWGHAIAPYWDVQLGARLDAGASADRQWLAVGIAGLAPYWFELETTAYVGSGGRTALRLEASYELLFSQQLILEPEVEVQLYGQNDPVRRLGSGLAEVSAGLRLRCECHREFAPYVGVEWSGNYGTTADYVRADGGSTRQLQWLAGVRFWF